MDEAMAAPLLMCTSAHFVCWCGSHPCGYCLLVIVIMCVCLCAVALLIKALMLIVILLKLCDCPQY